MKRFSEQFKKQSESIHLKASERNALRQRLVSYMEYHPLSTEMAQKVTSKKQNAEFIVSEPFKVFTFNKLYLRSFTGVFALFLIVGVPFVADHAVPGDVLYPVKVQFNEEVRASLSLSPYAKVAWETERLERRISEARLLASEGKLTDEAQTQVALAVKSHSDAAQREIAELRESDSDEAAIAEIAFASALAVQSEVLEGHIATSGDGRSVDSLIAMVSEARASVQAADTGAQPSYEKLLARVEQESTHVYELFQSVKKEASPEEVVDVERRLADVQRKVAEAISLKEEGVGSIDASGVLLTESGLSPAQRSALEVDASSESTSTDAALPDEKEAIVETVSTEQGTSTKDIIAPVDVDAQTIILLRSALTDIQKLLNYLTHIDVRENVTIENLVPKTLTSEERVFEVTKLFDDTRKLQATVDSHTPLQKNVQAKVSAGQLELTTKLAAAAAAMRVGKIDSGYALITEAHTLAADLVTIIKNDLENELTTKPLEADVVAESEGTSTDETDSKVIEN